VPKGLVTGGAGFIGSHLVEGLVGRGWEVRVLDNLSTGKMANLLAVQPQVEFLQGEIVDKALVAKAVQGCDVVFHLAAIASVASSVEAPLESHAACDTGTVTVLDAARRAGARRLVYAASSAAYGNLPGAVRVETEPTSPLSPYAAGKLAGELYCQAFTATYGFETVRLRFFNIFGPRQDPKSPYSGVIAIFLAAMNDGRVPRIDGDGLQSRDFTPVANVIQALIKAASAPAASGNVYNIGNGASITIIELVRQLNLLLGSKIEPTFGPARAGDVRHSQADIGLARRDLGYDPVVAFQTGLKQTIDWYRQGG
jgi:UDP-glucose 4-epimerase